MIAESLVSLDASPQKVGGLLAASSMTYSKPPSGRCAQVSQPVACAGSACPAARSASTASDCENAFAVSTLGAAVWEGPFGPPDTPAGVRVFSLVSSAVPSMADG